MRSFPPDSEGLLVEPADAAVEGVVGRELVRLAGEVEGKNDLSVMMLLV